MLHKLRLLKPRPTSHSLNLHDSLLPSFSGDGGRLNLPDACAPTKYCGSAPHTYRADPEQVRRTPASGPAEQ